MTYDEQYTTREWQEHAEASIKLSQERRASKRSYLVPTPLIRGATVALGVVAVGVGFWWFLLSSV